MNFRNGDPGGLFPIPAEEPPTNVVPLRGNGIIASQHLNAMVEAHEIDALGGIIPDQIQPASIDLRLGRRAHRVKASFLPGPNAMVMDKVRALNGWPTIELDREQGAVLERGRVYVVELLESLRLPSGVDGVANPKSSTGRLDIFTRLTTDKGVAFDRVPKGYRGKLFLEIAPLTFDIIVRQGSRLNQLRLQRGGRADLSQSDMKHRYESGQFVRTDEKLLPLRDNLVPVTVDLVGEPGAALIGYTAKQDAGTIDVDRVGYYDPREFWERIAPDNKRLNLNKNDFYILATREEVGVPPDMAAEMVAFDPSSGEFRVHYAGFFDPGFGWDGRAGGSRAVLEVRSHGVSFTLEHGQIIGWLDYSKLAIGKPDKLYGEASRSNYQGQGLKLAKHFLPFPP